MNKFDIESEGVVSSPADFFLVRWHTQVRFLSLALI